MIRLGNLGMTETFRPKSLEQAHRRPPPPVDWRPDNHWLFLRQDLEAGRDLERSTLIFATWPLEGGRQALIQRFSTGSGVVGAAPSPAAL